MDIKQLMPLPNEVFLPDQKFVIVLVGLPARGKTYISHRLTRYLNWIGISTKAFNVGNYRRESTVERKHTFFNPDNKEALELRLKASIKACEDLKSWLIKENGDVAIYDASNSTQERRQFLLQQFEGLSVIFIETIVTKLEMIQESIEEAYSLCPDYEGMSKEEAIQDYNERILHYEKIYETILENEEKNLSFIKILNQGEKYIVNRIKGSLPSRIMYFVMNIRVGHRTFYVSRHGESFLNIENRVGGNPGLTERGINYSKALADFMEKESISNLKVWTSQYRRTIETGAAVKCENREEWRALNEIQAGVYDGMSYQEIKTLHPEEFADRDKNKYTYRYPKGESYQDLVCRMEPVIMALEAEHNVLLICHQAVGRCLLGYFLDKEKDELTRSEFEFDTVYKLTPRAYGCGCEAFHLNRDHLSRQSSVQNT